MTNEEYLQKQINLLTNAILFLKDSILCSDRGSALSDWEREFSSQVNELDRRYKERNNDQ